MKDGSVGVYIGNIGKAGDGIEARPRQWSRGEQVVAPLGIREHFAAEEGSCFVNVNPTIGTGVKLQGDTNTAIAANGTNPSILIVNNDVPGQPASKNISLNFLKLLKTAVGAALTKYEYAVVLDSINRWASGGTDVSVNTRCTNMLSPNPSIAKIWYGATASAQTSMARQIDRGLLRAAIPVAGDQYMLSFGNGEAGLAAAALGGAAVIAQAYPVPSVVIGPGQSCLIYLFGAAMTTSPSDEYVLHWRES